ncbi:MAG: hypothetical protein D6725_15645 [Planctomycetota bacterium]|nr:MAG: hypothetical protein D6725_15645 [Planctomycetota bacterium]
MRTRRPGARESRTMERFRSNGMIRKPQRLGAVVPGEAAAAPARRGSVLIAVLVVVAGLSLATYAFTYLLLAEATGAQAFAEAAEARQAAESGIATVVAALYEDTPPEERNLYHDPARFQSIPVDGLTETGPRFSVVATDQGGEGDAPAAVRFGLTDLSGRLNLNTLLQLPVESEEMRREYLMYIPNMTPELADAILDWLDEDDQVREFGAERDDYLALPTPYERTTNGGLKSLDELLLVMGVTPELLYGEDANRNGRLDPNEDDGDQRPPVDNADGVLDRGWAAYLTVSSAERNVRSDGTERINVNHTVMTELYDALEAEFGEDVARFVVAYRLYGPAGGQDGTATVGSGSTGTAGGSRAAAQLGSALGQALAGGGNARITRGGLDLSRPASTQIRSLFDLVGATVEAEVDGVQTELQSPFPDDPNYLQGDFLTVLDALTTTDQSRLVGRINPATAPYEVLMSIPNMTEDLAGAIAAAQVDPADPTAAADRQLARRNPAWPYIEGLATLEQMRAIGPYITGGGDVFEGQVIGVSGSGRIVCRLLFTVDASESAPRILDRLDLTPLGPGIPLTLLQTR